MCLLYVLDHDLLQINNMSFSYHPNSEEPEKSKMLLNNVNLHMDMESRVGVLGVNGAGQQEHTLTHERKKPMCVYPNSLSNAHPPLLTFLSFSLPR